MIKGIYTAASSMVATQRNLNIISNNLANADTDGYKQDQGIKESFPEMLIQRLERDKPAKLIGSLGTGVKLQQTYTDFNQGGIKETGNQLDLAIKGEGFFVVQTPAGQRYTRNGNFTLNQQGQVVTQQGYQVLGERGPLQTLTGRDINIDADGQLFLGDLRGDQVQIVEFDNENLLQKVGDNLYELGEAQEEPATDSQLAQGYLERSNVNIVQSMVRMIETNRLYEANQKVVQSADQTLGKAVNDIGKLG